MPRFRRRLHLAALSLALAGVLLRGLIPAGFMPGIGSRDGGHGWLAICHAGALAVLAAAGDHHGGPAGDHGPCPFSTLASPALPNLAASLPPLPVFAAAPHPLAEAAAIDPHPHRSPPARGPPRA